MPRDFPVDLTEYGISYNDYRAMDFLCRTYPEKKMKVNASIRVSKSMSSGSPDRRSSKSDPTLKAVIARDPYIHVVHMIEHAAARAYPWDPQMLIKYVTRQATLRQILSQIRKPVNEKTIYAARKAFFLELYKEMYGRA